LLYVCNIMYIVRQKSLLLQPPTPQLPTPSLQLQLQPNPRSETFYCYLFYCLCYCAFYVSGISSPRHMSFELSECRKFINCLIETPSSCEVSECGWKMINWFVEIISSCEVSECGWKFINWLVEII
jgi:hypothetical protein